MSPAHHALGAGFWSRRPRPDPEVARWGAVLVPLCRGEMAIDFARRRLIELGMPETEAAKLVRSAGRNMTGVEA